MSKSNVFDNVELSKVSNIRLHIENNSTTIDSIVDEIISPYCKDLDKYVAFIRDCLKDGENPPTTSELEDFCLNLSTDLYFASGRCEVLGIRDDISKAVWKEMYNSARADGTGTVADKDSFAELKAQQEQIVNVCYSRAYKIMKAKVESAQEMLASCKKVLSHRMQEEALTNLNSGIGGY